MWLGLAPGSKQSGKRKGSQQRTRNRAALFWRLMVHGMNYVEEELKQSATRGAHTEQWLLQKPARKHGLVLMPKATG